MGYNEESGILAPVKSHMVYYYSGDKITNAKEFYEFSSNEKAAEAFKNKEKYSSRPESIKLNGKYIIYTFPTRQYENTSVEEIKSYFKGMYDNPYDVFEINETTEE